MIQPNAIRSQDLQAQQIPPRSPRTPEVAPAQNRPRSEEGLGQPDAAPTDRARETRPQAAAATPSTDAELARDHQQALGLGRLVDLLG